MATVEEVARQALQAVGSNAGVVVASGFFNTRYRNLAESGRFRHLRRFGQIVQPQNITAGLISITQNSPVVEGDADAQAAWASLGGEAGWFIKISGNWYEVLSLTGGNLLVSPEVLTPDVEDISYTLVKRYHLLERDCQWTGPFTFPKRRLHLREINSAEFELIEMDRNQTSGGPSCVVLNTPPDPQTSQKRVELYPYAGAASNLIRYLYWASPAPIEQTDELPSGLSADVMKVGIEMDLCSWEFGEAMKADKTEKAGYWRNEYNARMTRWEARDIDKALDVDTTKGLDSLEVLIRGNYSTSRNLGLPQSIANIFRR